MYLVICLVIGVEVFIIDTLVDLILDLVLVFVGGYVNYIVVFFGRIRSWVLLKNLYSYF